MGRRVLMCWAHWPEHHGSHSFFLSLPEQIFLHLVRLAVNHFLWSRAANSRKKIRGIQRVLINVQLASSFVQVISLVMTLVFCVQFLLMGCQLRNTFMPRSNLLTQSVIIAGYMKNQSLEHLFWECPHWQHIRQQHLTTQPLATSQTLPLCTHRTGLFLNTTAQIQQVADSHQQNCLDYSLTLVLSILVTLLLPFTRWWLTFWNHVTLIQGLAHLMISIPLHIYLLNRRPVVTYLLKLTILQPVIRPVDNQ